jgi:hypothetical protein
MERGGIVRSRADWCREHAFIREVSSGHPAMQQINPRVVAVWLRYDRR